jgi:hypothetical protein
MWIGKRKLEELLSGGESVVQLKKRIQELKDETKELELKKTMDEREIEHLVKLKEEKLNIEHQKKNLALQSEFKQKEMALQTTYHDKIMAKLENAAKEMKDVYTKIMERLPNVNMNIEKKVK